MDWNGYKDMYVYQILFQRESLFCYAFLPISLADKCFSQKYGGILDFAMLIRLP